MLWEFNGILVGFYWDFKGNVWDFNGILREIYGILMGF